MPRIFKNEPNFDIVGKTRVFVFVSAALIAVSIISMAALGLNYGVDFAGGYELQVQFPQDVSEKQLKSIIADVGIKDARVQRYGAEGSNEFLVLVRAHGTITEAGKRALRQDFAELAGGDEKLRRWEVAQSGESIKVGFAESVSKDQVQNVLQGRNLEVKNIEASERSDKPEFTISLVSLSAQIEDALRNSLSIPAEQNIVRRVDFRGPQMGRQLRNQGAMAVLYALVFILIYIAIRFDFHFSPGAVAALAHDVIITAGVFALLQIEFSLSIIAALLAIVGYSLNDTIVVYDRIRENGVRLRGRPLRALVNSSVNQTLSRTMLTSGTTLLVVLALLIFGGGIIRDFSIALLVGVLVGTYSSIGVAAPTYILMRDRADRKQADSSKQSSSAAVA